MKWMAVGVLLGVMSCGSTPGQQMQWNYNEERPYDIWRVCINDECWLKPKTWGATSDPHKFLATIPGKLGPGINTMSIEACKIIWIHDPTHGTPNSYRCSEASRTQVAR